MVNPLASRGLSGLLVVAGAVASAITCPIYVFKDPDVVEEPEATNLVTEIRRFAESVILLHSTSDLVNCLLNGTLNGSQLVVPKDQQLNSLEMALHAQNQSSELFLQHMVHGELHIVFHHSQYFAWTHCSSSGARNLSGGGFGQGPSRLPNVTLVACIPTSSLPTVVDGVYGTSSIFAWTAPQGAGRMTYMGADYFEVLPEWPQLLESSLASRCLEGNATTGTRTTTVTTTMPTTSRPNMVHTGCPVYMLNDPWIVDASQEGTNLLTEIRRFADSVIVLDSTSDLVALLGNGTLAGGQLVVPEQEWGSLSSALGSQSRSLLAQHIEAGLHLVVHSSVELIMQITGWSLWTTSCSAGSSAPQDLRGGGFGQGPGSLPSANLVACVPRSSSPSSMDGAYGTMHMLYAWTAPYGSGRITYMGADYFEVRPEWPELLESSLGARCYSGNTTTVTRTTIVTTTLTTATVTVTPLIVECGSVLYGSNVGQPNTIGSAAGDVWHMFCPTAAGTVEISTCGSDYDTFLYIQGSNIDYSCDDCGSCGSRTETTVTNFLPGECYNIIVGGFSSREGMYVLSISCEALTTTPPPVITTTPPPVITITCPIYFLNDPEIFDEPVEVANLLAAIRRFADPVILLNSTTDLVNSVANGTLGKQLIIPWPFYLYQNWQSHLDDEHRLLFIQKIEEGLHLVVHAALDLINLLSGWQTAWSYGCRFGESASQDLWGGGFGQGPSELPYQSRLGCIEIESLPSSVDGRYSTDEGVYAWTAPYGSGRITYYASTFLDVHPEWREILESSLGARCDSGNTTTVTRTTSVTTTLTTTTATGMPVQCGSIVRASTVGRGFARHTFCTENVSSGTVLVSTCGSSFDTMLSVQGPNVRRSCDDCGPCGIQTELKIYNFLWAEQVGAHDPEAHVRLREECADYMKKKPGDFQGFIEGDFEPYIAHMRQRGTWGGHIELKGLCFLFNVNAVVHQPCDSRAFLISGPTPATESSPCVQLSYHRTHHGGAHWNSVKFEEAGPSERSTLGEIKRRIGREGYFFDNF